jgi:ParB-like chromosome segregation protein Spo0J
MEEYENLKTSIKEHGFADYGIVYNKRFKRLVGGHQRVIILDALGIEEVLVTIVDVDEVREMSMNVALNKVEGLWDMPKLQDLFNKIKMIDEKELDLTGFSQTDISKILESFEKEDIPDEFDKFDETVDFEYKCPKCGYVWSGNPK